MIMSSLGAKIGMGTGLFNMLTFWASSRPDVAINWMLFWGMVVLGSLYAMATDDVGLAPKDMSIFGHEEGFQPGAGPAKV